MDSPFMAEVAAGLGSRGWRVVRFEFPYMVRRREDGKKRPPDRQALLLDTWRSVIAELGSEHLIIGGKSMGGRMASLIADESEVTGLVCLGYPFHPPGKPERLRIDQLREMTTPALLVQGTRDPFGGAEEVAEYPLSPAIRIHWAEDGNHDLAPRKRSGRTADQNLAEALAAMDGFLRERVQGGVSA